MPGVSCPHHWVYRTVCPEGAEAPHPGFYSLFNRSESNRKYDYKFIFVDVWRRRKVSHTSSIDSLFHIHWSTNTFLINYSFIPYYNIIIHCRYSFTPLLTQNNPHIRDSSSKYHFLRLYYSLLPLVASLSLLRICQLP